jgi:hypothetical protein
MVIGLRLTGDSLSSLRPDELDYPANTLRTCSTPHRIAFLIGVPVTALAAMFGGM